MPCHTDRAVNRWNQKPIGPSKTACAIASWALVLAAAGCNGVNPAYEGGAGGGSGSATSSNPTTSATPPGPDGSADGDTNQMTGGASLTSGNPSTTEPGGTDEGPLDTDDETGTEPACRPFDIEIPIEVNDANGPIEHSLGCDAEVVLTGQFEDLPDGSLAIHPCENAGCKGCNFVSFPTITLGPPAYVPTDTLGCGQVRAFEGYSTLDGTCIWATIAAIDDSTPDRPTLVASNQPHGVAGIPEAKPVVIDGCTEPRLCNGTGVGLVGALFDGDEWVEPGEEAELNLGPGMYWVSLFDSEIYDDADPKLACAHQIAWTAEYVGPVKP